MAYWETKEHGSHIRCNHNYGDGCYTLSLERHSALWWFTIHAHKTIQPDFRGISGSIKGSKPWKTPDAQRWALQLLDAIAYPSLINQE